MLATAERPMIFVGDGVAYSGAAAELARVAELLGAEVWECDAGEVNLDYAHPLYQGATGHMFGYKSLPITSKGDVNLVCGTYMVPEVFPELGDIFGKGRQVIHIDLNAYEIGKNHPVTMGMVADPKLTLARLATALEATLTAQATHRRRGARRGHGPGQEPSASRPRARGGPQGTRQDADALLPLHGGAGAAAAGGRRRLRRGADHVARADRATGRRTTTGQYFLTRGGSLGVGIPGAIGAKLANPDKTVIGFTGDGGRMYTIQALWTAARHNVDAKFVVCNNAPTSCCRAEHLRLLAGAEISAARLPGVLRSLLAADPLRRVGRIDGRAGAARGEAGADRGRRREGPGPQGAVPA